MPSVIVILAVSTVVTAILTAMGKCPVFVPVLLGAITVLLFVLPR